MQPRRVEILKRETVFQGYFRIDRYQLRHEQFAGGLGAPVSREVFERGQVAAVLPIDPRAEKVVLIEQFRPGAWAAGSDPWLIECVAGVIEQGEVAAEVCIRETQEEAGLLICDLVQIVPPYLSSPGACSETVSLFCGRVDASSAHGLHGLADEGEDIRVGSWTFDAALQLLDEGRIVNAKTIIALQWLALNRHTFAERWP
ncbi:MAG: ADP-ribose pyrophosphatase [Gammaproteobacteria bacterium]|jgi:ADP-ribose pyrophosphatase